MKALVYKQYGGLEKLHFSTLAEPQSPGPGELKIAIKAVSLNRADALLLSGKPFVARLMAGMFKPKFTVLGADVAGIVEEVGEGVHGFSVGDAVFGDLSGVGFGGLKQKVAAPARLFCKMPIGISFEQAAAIPMATCTAYQALVVQGLVQQGSRVLINGASGGVGTSAIQIAKILGAEVTGICHSRNAQRALDLGATHVVAYDQKMGLPNHTYDVILDIAANKPAKHWLDQLNPTGSLVAVGFSPSTILSSLTHRQVKVLLAKPNAEELGTFSKWMEQGWFKPVIAHTFSFDEAIPAFATLIQGKPNGKVVIRI